MIKVEELKQDERRFWGAESHVDERLADNGPRVVGAAIDQGIVLAGSVIVLGFGFGVHGFARVVVAALLAFAYFTVAIGLGPNRRCSNHVGTGDTGPPR